MTLHRHSLRQPAADTVDPLKGLDDEALMRLRNAIDKKLDIDPKSLNMANELGLQYKAGKTLLASIQDDAGVPANQRSQVFNSVGVMLDKISKQMKVAYDAERLKRYEAAFMKVLVELPEDAKRRFFDLYADYLNEDGSPK